MTSLPDGLTAPSFRVPELTITHGGKTEQHGLIATDALRMHVVLCENRPPGEYTMAVLIPIDATTPGRVETLMRFWQAISHRPVSPDTRLTRQQQLRLRQTLQAIDGHLDGASYRDVAEAIYGLDRVETEAWSTSPLRAGVIRMVKSGTALIAGKYRRLLRHDRRP